MPHELHIGDAETVLKTLPDESYQLIVTSPPYWNIKDYGHPDQIGHGQDYAHYLARMKGVFDECARVLSPGCRIAVNIGDQFLRAKESPSGEYTVIPIHADFIQLLEGTGMTPLGNIIWRKITTTKTSGGGTWMGSTYHPRDGHITYEHEYILVFRKKGKTPHPRRKPRSTVGCPRSSAVSGSGGSGRSRPCARRITRRCSPSSYPLA